ncbi:MAG TPA: hypothetical protein VE860_03605 [Chthoniobacterales bacterium]|jgi:outer membrane receptor for monomeric catechols|nr:hypothetical protein [Chthoniobacterales bacterium]
MPGNFANKFLASIAVAAGAMAFLPGTACAQQANAAPTDPSANAQTATSGGQLQQITVTGYILPRVGDGPQPVTTIDRDFISKLAAQTTQDALQVLPGAEANWNTGVTACK